MASVKSSAALEWKFSQVFGERIPGEEIEYDDIISAIEFEKRGKYLAVGDNAGRVVLFEQMDGKDPRSRKELEKSDYPVNWHPKYRFKTEFQSHYPEVDYMMNLEIEEKINKVRWCATPNDAALFILSANNRTIKLWKVLDRKAKKAKEMDPNPFVYSENALLSEISFMSEGNEASVPNGYRLEWTNKVLKKDGPLQPDALAMILKKVILAHFDELALIVSEVITSAEFHPVYCNLLAYSSTRGFIRLVDMRRSALCDQHARMDSSCDLFQVFSYGAGNKEATTLEASKTPYRYTFNVPSMLLLQELAKKRC
ncbi:hypothetical protein ACLOJK_032567 [Asimina triloba]